jgi:hypothetical protein
MSPESPPPYVHLMPVSATLVDLADPFPVAGGGASPHPCWENNCASGSGYFANCEWFARGVAGAAEGVAAGSFPSPGAVFQHLEGVAFGVADRRRFGQGAKSGMTCLFHLGIVGLVENSPIVPEKYSGSCA